MNGIFKVEFFVESTQLTRADLENLIDEILERAEDEFLSNGVYYRRDITVENQ